jgi:hypothetical protein
VIGALRRWRDRRGCLPDKLRVELEAEGLELLEERLPATVIYRGYEAPGQRPQSGVQKGLVAIAFTPRRLVVHGTSSIRLEVPRGTSVMTADPGEVRLTYDAATANPPRAGEIELRLKTPRADAIRATLSQWMTGRSS